jgi:hypothetical protein
MFFGIFIVSQRAPVNYNDGLQALKIIEKYIPDRRQHETTDGKC